MIQTYPWTHDSWIYYLTLDTCCLPEEEFNKLSSFMPESPHLSARDPLLTHSSPPVRSKKRKQPPSCLSTSPLGPDSTSSGSFSSSSQQQQQQQQRYQQSTIPALFASNSQEFIVSEPAKKIRSDSPPEASAQQFLKTANPMISSPVNRDVIDLTKTPSHIRVSEKTGKPSSKNALPAALPPRNGAMKLTVKNLKRTPNSVPEAYVKQTWESLDAALTAIFDETNVPTSMEELYRGTEDLCRAEKAPIVFDNLKARCTDYISVSMKTNLLERSRYSDEIVRLVESAWSKWCKQLVSLCILIHSR